MVAVWNISTLAYRMVIEPRLNNINFSMNINNTMNNKNNSKNNKYDFLSVRHEFIMHPFF